MHDMLKKLMEKKGVSKMDDTEKEAKKGMLKQLIKEMDGLMLEPIKSLKKVTVAAKDEEGLKEGLKKAEEVVDEMPKEEEDSDEENMEASEEQSEGENEEMSLEQIDAMMKKLEEMKQKKMME